MFLHLDGRYRKTNECNFLEQVEEELTKFVKNSKHNRVLVFPPLASQYRFLIHQLVGNCPALQTVSIGQGKERRTVVYQGERRYGRVRAETYVCVNLECILVCYKMYILTTSFGPFD